MYVHNEEGMRRAHGSALPLDWYWACSKPEAPLADETIVDFECRNCVLWLGACARSTPDELGYGDDATISSARQAYEYSYARHGLPAL